MRLSAIQGLTLLDFPGHIACTAFLPGCNFRCGYCHNPEFVLPDRLEKIADSFISPETFYHFLDERRGLLEGVCITGGEPTIHRDLPDCIRGIRSRGFLVKLDTNGSRPQVVRALLDEGLLDYIAMDIKAGSAAGYSAFCGVDVDFDAIKESIALLKTSGIDYEFRTTMVREFHSEQEYQSILALIGDAPLYALQNFSARTGCLSRDWESCHGFSDQQLEDRRRIALETVTQCSVRS